MPGRLIPAYREMHQRHMFPGLSIGPFIPEITHLVVATRPKSILDYGCGEGHQYIVERYHQAWAEKPPTLYDPAVPAHDKKPPGKFDAVLCTDVLEHVPEDELDTVIAEIIRYTRKWAFISVCCRPAKRKFPDGANVHVTIKPFDWWQVELGARFALAGRRLILRETP